MNRRIWLSVVVLATLGFAGISTILWRLAAAAETSQATTRETTPNRTLTLSGKPPAESDTLMLHYPDDPETVNPVTANDTVSEALMRPVYDSLAEPKFSDPDLWEPSLATSWELDPKTLEYTIHLRKGVYWHPIKLPGGKELPKTEFTNRDVKFTFDCILNKNVEAAHLRSYYEDPEAKEESERFKIKITLPRGDKYTVKIKWTKPYFLATEYTLDIPIIPRHVFSVDENGQPISFDFSSKEFAKGFNNHWANNQMCGTGPMMFKQWKRNQQVVLERNPDYWGSPFYFKEIIYRNIKNPNTALQAVLHNQLDWAAIPEKDQYIQSKEHANVKSGAVTLTEFRYPAYRYLGYNQKRQFFKDKRVRMAIGHAVPVDEIIDKVFHGLAERLTGPFLPGSSSNDASLKPIKFDLDEAGRLLDEAGWKLEPGAAVRKKSVDGKETQAKFDLIIYSSSPSFATIASIIKENCRKIGVDVQISSTDWALMLNKLNKKEFDACIMGWAMSWHDDPFQIWHGSQADVDDSSNHVAYKNPAVDKLIEQLRTTMEPETLPAIYRQIHRLIYDDQPYTFLFVDKATAAYDSRIENLKLYKIRPCYDVREWSAKKARVLQ